MRKSEPLDLTPKGNASKFFSYREAWTRIKTAQEHGFYIEAVTIQKSIISDRLISYFKASDVVLKKYPSFGYLVVLWKKQPAIIHKDIENLQESIDQWRIRRNQIVHDIVKVQVEAEITAIDDFLIDAQSVATDGTILTRAVCNWHDRVKARKHL